MIIVVMGVSGSGKSTLANALAERLRWLFVEGDDFHPQENIDKLRRGEALTDADRWPWLAELNRRIRQLDHEGRNAVLACSALKTDYRQRLSEGVGEIRYVHLAGDERTLKDRLGHRRGHFMPADLLGSQLNTLEPPQEAVRVNIHTPLADQVEQVEQSLDLVEGK